MEIVLSGTFEVRDSYEDSDGGRVRLLALKADDRVLIYEIFGFDESVAILRRVMIVEKEKDDTV